MWNRPPAPAVKREAEEDWGRGAVAMKTRTHFTFRIDMWTANGESIVEHVAGVEDYQVAPPTTPPVNVGPAPPSPCGRARV
jgi:hypothetical protein